MTPSRPTLSGSTCVGTGLGGEKGPALPSLAGRRCFCNCNAPVRHQVLVGRSAAHGMNWTRVAQTYPRGLCADLAFALGLQVGWSPSQDGDASNGCSRTGLSRRIGEADNPGPSGLHVSFRALCLINHPQLALSVRLGRLLHAGKKLSRQSIEFLYPSLLFKVW